LMLLRVAEMQVAAESGQQRIQSDQSSIDRDEETDVDEMQNLRSWKGATGNQTLKTSH
jgi:hypothetical protein